MEADLFVFGENMGKAAMSPALNDFRDTVTDFRKTEPWSADAGVT